MAGCGVQTQTPLGAGIPSQDSQHRSGPVKHEGQRHERIHTH